MGTFSSQWYTKARIFWPTGPTKMVHLSKFTGLNKEMCQIVLWSANRIATSETRPKLDKMFYVCHYVWLALKLCWHFLFSLPETECNHSGTCDVMMNKSKCFFMDLWIYEYTVSVLTRLRSPEEVLTLQLTPCYRVRTGGSPLEPL